MRGRLFGRRWCLFAVGAVLCLLAALFAFEAKLAWFSPAGTPCAQISATKLQPADTSKLIAQALASSSQHFPAEAPLLLALALLAVLIAFFFRGSVRDGLTPRAFSSFSPPLFRRPPPQS